MFLRTQAKTSLSKELPAVAVELEPATTVKTGLQAGGEGSWNTDKNWPSWNDSPSSRWKNHDRSAERAWQEGREIEGNAKIASFYSKITNRIKPRR